MIIKLNVNALYTHFQYYIFLLRYRYVNVPYFEIVYDKCLIKLHNSNCTSECAYLYYRNVQ